MENKGKNLIDKSLRGTILITSKKRVDWLESYDKPYNQWLWFAVSYECYEFNTSLLNQWPKN